MFNTLYGKDKAGGLKVWSVTTEGADVIVSHGKLGGKIQTKTTTSEGKNIGKANETSPAEQAVIEAKAKWVKQKKSGYFETQEEAMASEKWTPMKCQDFKKFAHKVITGGHVQPKLNGVRCMVAKTGEAMSKAGEPYTLPEHIQKAVDKLKAEGHVLYGLDGEIYAGLEHEGGLSLQRIVSAFRKPNEDTHKLRYYIYDIPDKNSEWEYRKVMLDRLEQAVFDLGLGDVLVVVPSYEVVFMSHYDFLHERFVAKGYEGSIYRNAKGVYEFDVRSYDVIKRKPRQDIEVNVIAVRKDKNGQGVCTGRLENGVEVDFLMLKEAHPEINYRLYENALTLIGTFVTIAYEEFSDEGTPTKPVGEKLREVEIAEDGTWIVKE